jgi:hypothetical protein
VIPEEAVAHVAATLGTSTARARRLAHTALPAGFVRSVRGAAAVVLVEGPTDVAVLQVLLPGVPVVAAGGKNVLPLAAAVASALGAAAHVVLDADSGGWRRAGNPGLARVNHRRATERVLTALGAVPRTVLPDDLEAELAGWPSFLEALRNSGSTLLEKDPRAYAQAAARAGRTDLPDALHRLVHEVTSAPRPPDGGGPVSAG